VDSPRDSEDAVKDALLTFEQARTRLNIGKSTLYELLERGKLRAAKIGGGWRIEPADLEAFIESKKRGALPATTVAVSAAFDADDDLPPVQVQRFQ
jgi:excisionase family DNA binding protein